MRIYNEDEFDREDVKNIEHLYSPKECYRISFKDGSRYDILNYSDVPREIRFMIREGGSKEEVLIDIENKKTILEDLIS